MPGFATDLEAALLQRTAGSIAAEHPRPTELRELSADEEAEIKDTAQQLEGLMLYQLLKQMWDSIPESDLLPAGNAGRIYREMWLERIAEQTSRSAEGIGIARTIQRQLTEQARRSYTAEQFSALA